MWRVSLTLFVLAIFAGGTFAQDQDSVSKAVTVVMARAGERTDSDPISTYHFVEVFQVRGKWIYPDIGYVDFGHNNYREFFAGGGYTLYKSKRITAIGELLYGQSLGPAAHSARWQPPDLWPRARGPQRRQARKWPSCSKPSKQNCIAPPICAMSTAKSSFSTRRPAPPGRAMASARV